MVAILSQSGLCTLWAIHDVRLSRVYLPWMEVGASEPASHGSEGPGCDLGEMAQRLPGAGDIALSGPRPSRIKHGSDALKECPLGPHGLYRATALAIWKRRRGRAAARR